MGNPESKQAGSELGSPGPAQTSSGPPSSPGPTRSYSQTFSSSSNAPQSPSSPRVRPQNGSTTTNSPGPAPFGTSPPEAPVKEIPYTVYSLDKAPDKKLQLEKPKLVRAASAPVPAHTAEDYHMEKFKRLPMFTPIITSRKQAFDDIDQKGLLRTFADIQRHYTNQAEYVARETKKLSNTIKQMDLACIKAKSLASQHCMQVIKVTSTFPHVEQMCAQVSQAYATITRIKDAFAYLEDILEDLESRPTSPTLSPGRTLSDSSSSITPSSPSITPSSSHSSLSSLTLDSLEKEIEPPPVVATRPPKAKRSIHGSPYLAAKPRGAVPKTQRASISEGVHPANSSPTATPIEVWTCNIIPKWHELKVRETPWVRAMWKNGIPKHLRGQVWQLAIENKLQITNELYTKLLEEADAIEDSNVHREIEVDVNRTFAQHDVGDLEVFREKLHKVLKAYSHLKADVGYVQGMSYIAGMFLHYMNDYEAFMCFSNVLENNFLKRLFRLDMAIIDKYVSVFGTLLTQIEPKLDKHFNEVGLIPQHYLLQWWLPIFTKSLPLEICGKIWDCFFLDGELFAFVASLGILRLYRKTLKYMDMESCKKLLSNLPPDIPEEELFVAIESIPAPLYNSVLDTLHDIV